MSQPFQLVTTITVFSNTYSYRGCPSYVSFFLFFLVNDRLGTLGLVNLQITLSLKYLQISRFRCLQFLSRFPYTTGFILPSFTTFLYSESFGFFWVSFQKPLSQSNTLFLMSVNSRLSTYLLTMIVTVLEICTVTQNVYMVVQMEVVKVPTVVFYTLRIRFNLWY